MFSLQKIFVLIPWYEPAHKSAGPYQSFVNMVHELGGRFEFYIFTSDCDWYGYPMQFGVKGERNVWFPYDKNTYVFFADKKRRDRAFVQAQINFIRPDMLYINGVFNRQFNRRFLTYLKHPRTLWSPRGDLHPTKMRKLLWLKEFYLWRLRRAKIHRRFIFHAMDDQEERDIKEHFGTGLQIRRARNIPWLLHPMVFRKMKPNYLGVLQIDILGEHNNQLMVVEALRKIGKHKEIIDYLMYGKMKSRAFYKRIQNASQGFPENVRVAYKSHVVHTSMLYRLPFCEVAIFPHDHDSSGLKIVETLSYGMPVICSKTCAWQDLEAVKAGLNIDLNPDAIHAAIIFFLRMHPLEYMVWSKSAAKHARKLMEIDERVEEGFRLLRID